MSVKRSVPFNPKTLYRTFNKYIFKFLVIDKFFEENLENNELITRCFDNFNDPYDAHYGVNAIWPNPYRETDKLKKLIKNIEPKRYQELTKSKESIIQYINSKAHLLDYTYKYVSENLEKFRICSFTKRWNHILMWSHYADGCRGLALIFDQERIPEGSNSRLLGSNGSVNGTTIPMQWVKYKNIPPLLNAVDVLESARIGTDESINAITKKMLEVCALTKYKKWSYEQESRLIARYDGNFDKKPVMYQYRSDVLKGAIIGHKCDPRKVTNIAKLMPDESIIYFAKAVTDKYKVVINEAYLAKQIADGKVKLEVKVD